MAQRLKIYLDMDGVLSNFAMAYARLTGKAEHEWSKDNDVFWAPILKKRRFWLDIPKMEDADILWDFVHKHHYVVVLSSPGHHDTERAVIQKRRWLEEHFGTSFNLVLKQSEEKHHYACPNSVLIDDWGKNVKAWEAAGGKAIHHKSVATTIAQLQLYGVGRILS